MKGAEIRVFGFFRRGVEKPRRKSAGEGKKSPEKGGGGKGKNSRKQPKSLKKEPDRGKTAESEKYGEGGGKIAGMVGKKARGRERGRRSPGGTGFSPRVQEGLV
jgi:hypothetical protein